MFNPKKVSGPSLANALGLSSSITVIRGEDTDESVIKAEHELLRSQALTVEDGDNQVSAFEALGKGVVIKPTYNPFQLYMLVQNNNTLMQCVSAMEVNIDGTGYEIARADGEPISDADKETVKIIKQFFDEPYPGESFVTQRRTLRRDMESGGNGYVEVLRSTIGEIAFLRIADAKLMRLCKLDSDPMPVTKKVMRNGKEITVKAMERPRKFAMVVGAKLRYFKEFGAPSFLNAVTGTWTSTSNGADEATEIIHLKVFPDVTTMYGVPRWINQTPSVLGSRKAEEFNLEFFNAGGLPPAMVLVQGGQLSPESRANLTFYLSGKAKFKQRAVLAEIFPVGGSLDGSGGQVKVTVERFGDERQKDSMFQTYDKNCGDHVRTGFRLPQLFVGQSQDQNFATAQASYIVAEAQVFKPEREEFDEVINVKVMRELWPDYLFRSLPMSMNDVANQLKGLTMVKDMADPEGFVKQVNEVSSINVSLREGYAEEQAKRLAADTALKLSGMDPDDPKNQEQGDDGKPKPKVAISKIELGDDGSFSTMADDILIDLAQDYADHTAGRKDFTDDQLGAMTGLIDTMGTHVRTLFNGMVAERMMHPTHDAKGVAELLAVAGDLSGHPSDCGCGAH